MENREKTEFTALKKIVKGMVIGVLISIAILVLASFAVLNGAFSEKAFSSIALFAAFIGVLFAGLIGLPKNAPKRWLLGLGVGLAIFFVFFIFGMFFAFPPKGYNILQMMITVLAAGVLSSLIGTKRKNKHKHR